MYAKRGAPVTVVDVRLEHLAIAARYAAEPEQWPVAPRFNPVDRWYHRLAAADDHEVWLLTWLPGQGTDLHDHGGSAGAFHVLSGSPGGGTVIPGSAARLTPRGTRGGARPPIRRPAHPPDHQPLEPAGDQRACVRSRADHDDPVPHRRRG